MLTNNELQLHTCTLIKELDKIVDFLFTLYYQTTYTLIKNCYLASKYRALPILQRYDSALFYYFPIYYEQPH